MSVTSTSLRESIIDLIKRDKITWRDNTNRGRSFRIWDENDTGYRTATRAERAALHALLAERHAEAFRAAGYVFAPFGGIEWRG